MFSCMKLYGLPGGNQVDGLPPAASTVGWAASWPVGGATELFVILRSFFEKVEFFYIKTIFSEFVLLKLVNAEAHARGFAPL